MRNSQEHAAYMRNSEETTLFDGIYVDNKSTIALYKNLVLHARSKHIDMCYHYFRTFMEEGQVELDHVNTNDRLVDIFTKAGDWGEEHPLHQDQGGD